MSVMFSSIRDEGYVAEIQLLQHPTWKSLEAETIVPISSFVVFPYPLYQLEVFLVLDDERLSSFRVVREVFHGDWLRVAREISSPVVESMMK
jgi:hypothetical protein